jgi:hypothetical protein
MDTHSIFLVSAWRGTGPEFVSAVEDCSTEIKAVVDQFSENLHGAAATISIPHRLAIGSLASRRVEEAFERERGLEGTIGRLALARPNGD